jgi:hypothetical protein
LEKTKREKKLTDDKLQREYNLGLPESGGALFKNKDIEKCATGQWQSPQIKRSYLAGIDPNFGGNDFYVFLIWEPRIPIITSFQLHLEELLNN